MMRKIVASLLLLLPQFSHALMCEPVSEYLLLECTEKSCTKGAHILEVSYPYYCARRPVLSDTKKFFSTYGYEAIKSKFGENFKPGVYELKFARRWHRYSKTDFVMELTHDTLSLYNQSDDLPDSLKALTLEQLKNRREDKAILQEIDKYYIKHSDFTFYDSKDYNNVLDSWTEKENQGRNEYVKYLIYAWGLVIACSIIIIFTAYKFFRNTWRTLKSGARVKSVLKYLFVQIVVFLMIGFWWSFDTWGIPQAAFPSLLIIIPILAIELGYLIALKLWLHRIKP